MSETGPASDPNQLEFDSHNPDQLNLGQELLRADDKSNMTKDHLQEAARLEAEASQTRAEWDRIDGTGRDDEQKKLTQDAKKNDAEAAAKLEKALGIGRIVDSMADNQLRRAPNLDDDRSRKRLESDRVQPGRFIPGEQAEENDDAQA